MDIKLASEEKMPSVPAVDLASEPAIRYSRDKETVLINIETDADFIRDINEIAEKKRATSGSIFDVKEDINEEQCVEIH